MNHSVLPRDIRRSLTAGRAGAGFTLIELLVVISIIILLMTILTPTVRSIIERGRESVCQSNLRQIGFAHKEFSGTQIRAGLYAPGIPNIEPVANLPSIENIWLKAGVNDPDYGLYRAHGILANRKLVAPEVMYCPSWDIESWLPGNMDKATLAGGWMPEGSRGSMTAIVSTYYTRNTFLSPGTTAPGGWRPAKGGEDPDTQALMCDAFYGDVDMGDSGIKKGYRLQHDPNVGVIYLDNHAEFFVPVDKTNRLVPNVIVTGNWGANQTLYTKFEQVFRDFLSKM